MISPAPGVPVNDDQTAQCIVIQSNYKIKMTHW